MFTSILGTQEIDLNEKIPTSSPPWVWIGFLFAAAFFVVAFTLGVMEVLAVEADTIRMLNAMLTILGFVSLIYWLICIHRIHKIMAEITDNRYAITPGESVWKHFIPILSIIFLFQWPNELSTYLNERGRVKMISGYAIGGMLLFAFVLRLFDGAFGTAALFGITLFISSKLKAHVRELKGVTPDQLPPLPDPTIFSRPIETSTSPAQETVERSQVGSSL